MNYGMNRVLRSFVCSFSWQVYIFLHSAHWNWFGGLIAVENLTRIAFNVHIFFCCDSLMNDIRLGAIQRTKCTIQGDGRNGCTSLPMFNYNLIKRMHTDCRPNMDTYSSGVCLKCVILPFESLIFVGIFFFFLSFVPKKCISITMPEFVNSFIAIQRV